MQANLFGNQVSKEIAKGIVLIKEHVLIPASPPISQFAFYLVNSSLKDIDFVADFTGSEVTSVLANKDAVGNSAMFAAGSAGGMPGEGEEGKEGQEKGTAGESLGRNA